MKGLQFGLAFILGLALLLTASSFFFHRGSDSHFNENAEPTLTQSDSHLLNAQEAESIGDEKKMTEDSLDGEATAATEDETAEEPESNLEIVFITLAQEMSRRGYSKDLSNCIETQFRENQGIENPKDLDSMLLVCDSQFKVEATQSKQIKDVVLQAIAKAQNKPEAEEEKTTVQ